MINEKKTIFRPIGSYHPEYKDTYYPINYGYVEGIIAPDGEEQDAYILGITEPVKEFIGKVIAIIHRYDDVEEKWVVAPENASFTKDEIIEQVKFQEQYLNLPAISQIDSYISCPAIYSNASFASSTCSLSSLILHIRIGFPFKSFTCVYNSTRTSLSINNSSFRKSLI